MQFMGNAVQSIISHLARGSIKPRMKEQKPCYQVLATCETASKGLWLIGLILTTARLDLCQHKIQFSFTLICLWLTNKDWQKLKLSFITWFTVWTGEIKWIIAVCGSLQNDDTRGAGYLFFDYNLCFISVGICHDVYHMTKTCSVWKSCQSTGFQRKGRGSFTFPRMKWQHLSAESFYKYTRYLRKEFTLFMGPENAKIMSYLYDTVELNLFPQHNIECSKHQLKLD